jgi:hypothetical protein
MKKTEGFWPRYNRWATFGAVDTALAAMKKRNGEWKRRPLVAGDLLFMTKHGHIIDCSSTDTVSTAPSVLIKNILSFLGHQETKKQWKASMLELQLQRLLKAAR